MGWTCSGFKLKKRGKFGTAYKRTVPFDICIPLIHNKTPSKEDLIPLVMGNIVVNLAIITSIIVKETTDAGKGAKTSGN